MRRKAFTILELLVVIGIIVLIAAILLPTLSRTYREAQRARQAADLHAIETGLEAYKNDFGDYPRFDPQGTNTATSGASLLCWALLAPGPERQDGYGDPTDTQTPGTVLGVGFRVRGNQGKVYSYLQPDQFKIGRPPTDMKYDDTVDFIADRWGNPILYYPVAKSANVHTPTGYVGNVTYSGSSATPQPQPYLNGHDNSTLQYTNQIDNQMYMGPMPQDLATLIGAQYNSPLPTGSQPIATNYILWSAGPNGIFGAGPNANKPVEKQPKNPATWDDVTNIAQ